MSDNPPFAVTVDLVVLTIRRAERGDLELCAALVRRKKWPHAGYWALPGGFVKRDRQEPRGEDLLEAARRELEEETGLSRELPIPYLEQLGAYGAPTRDPRGNVVTVAYLAVVPFASVASRAVGDHEGLREGGDAAVVEWRPVRSALSEGLAFDHARILADGVERVRALIKSTDLALAFLREPFLLPELRHVYEIVWGPLPPETEVDVSNFYARVADAGKGKQAKIPFVTRVQDSVPDSSSDSFGKVVPAKGRKAQTYYRRNEDLQRQGAAYLLERPITLAAFRKERPKPVVILHVPHGSDEVPPDLLPRFLLDEERLRLEKLRMTDWFVRDLFDVPGGKTEQVEFTLIEYDVSRLVCDPERFEDNDREVMASQGMGVFYTATHDGRSLRQPPDDDEREMLLDRYYRPHHAKLAAAVADALARERPCLIVDAHSIPSHPLPFEGDQSKDRPAINLGADDFHAPPWLRDRALEAFSARFDSVTLNRSRESEGAFVPAAYFGSDRRVSAIMVEVNRGLYLNEETGEQLPGFDGVATSIQDALRDIAAGW